VLLLGGLRRGEGGCVYACVGWRGRGKSGSTLIVDGVFAVFANSPLRLAPSRLISSWLIPVSVPTSFLSLVLCLYLSMITLLGPAPLLRFFRLSPKIVTPMYHPPTHRSARLYTVTSFFEFESVVGGFHFDLLVG